MAYLPNRHGAMSSLDADDHPQYQTDAEADARYPSKTGVGASGSWPINITGRAASAGSAPEAGNTGNVDYAWDHQRGIWAFHLHWQDVGPLTYLWTSDDNANNYVIHESNWSRSGHNHDGNYGAQWSFNHVDVGTLAATTSYGPWVWGHGLGMGPRTVMPTPTYDDNTHSCVASIGNLWDTVNVAVVGRNLGSGAEAVAMGFIAWG